MMNNKVTVTADPTGAVISVSKNNPEYGFIRLVQSRGIITETGWVKPTTLSTLLKGTVEDLQSMGFRAGQELPGKIIIKEQTDPFTDQNPDRHLKVAGLTGIVCCSYGEPIYRDTFYTTDVNAEDVLVPHTNREEIKEANKQIRSSTESLTKMMNTIREQSDSQIEEMASAVL